jgi:acetyl-CoA acetyltransferase
VIEKPEQGAVISGIGISRIGRRMGVPGLELTLESSERALADAGLSWSDIDGVDTVGDTPIHEVARARNLELGWAGGGVSNGGLLSPLMSAIVAVAEGRARHALVYRTVQMMGGAILPPAGEPPPRAVMEAAEAAMPMGDMPALLAYHAYSAANWLAMHCRRHMYLYGTTKEQLGALAVNSRRFAGLNPLAVFRDPITLDDYLRARPISDPFGLLDCDVPVDGSIALVVSPAGGASEFAHPVRIAAMGGADGHGGWDQRPDYPKMASVDAAADLWSRTELGPSDVDVAELYDGFTFITLAWLEALGFCLDGEAGPFVADPGRIALGGQLPLNTYGGQLSAGRLHGYWIVHEACLQLQHQAEKRQVEGAEVAIAAVGGGPIAGCLLLTR